MVPQFPITRVGDQEDSSAAFVGAALGAMAGALAGALLQQQQGTPQPAPGQLELLQQQNALLQQQNAALAQALAQVLQGQCQPDSLIPVLRRR